MNANDTTDARTDDELTRGDDHDAEDVAEGDRILVHYESVYGDTGDDSHEVRGTVVEAGRSRVVVEDDDGETYDLVLDGGLAVELEKRDSHGNGRRVGYPTAVASSGDGDDAPQFEVGEQVAEDDEDGGTMRVLDADVGAAGEVEVGTTGTTVADYDGNEDVSDDERVVEVVFESFLDSNAPEWDMTPADELPEFLDAYADEWGVPIRTYSYPESRLTADVSDDESDGAEDTDDDEDGDEDAHDAESEGTGATMPSPTHDARPDGTTRSPDLPAGDDDEDGDEDAHDARADGGRESDAWFDPLPSPESVANHVAPFPGYRSDYRHRAAVHYLVRGQVERTVEREREVGA